MFSPRRNSILVSPDHHQTSHDSIVPGEPPNALLSQRNNSAKAAKKKKKLSSKGKAKIAEARAKEALKSQRGPLAADLTAASPEKASEKPAKSNKSQLEELKKAELDKLDAEENVRKEKKLQKHHNLMMNAQRSGMKVVDYSERAADDKKSKKKEKKKEKSKEEIELKEPVPIMKEILEKCLIGRLAALEFLKLENTQKFLHETEFKFLKASLEVAMHMRPSALNFKVEMLWRFAVIIFETAVLVGPRRELNLKLSHFAYNLVLSFATPNSHPLHYAVLKNSLELCEAELDKLEYQKLMNKNNAEFLFEPPNFSEKYEGEKIVFKMKKHPLAGQINAPPAPIIDIEAIKARRMSLESSDGY